ncbi:MAG: hypothetical protein J6X45_03245, partial [Lachnospiraceae bacterium]|nr:hypothetical protein [Lachnospiraceae bacterium]
IIAVAIGLFLLFFMYEAYESNRRLKRLRIKAKESYGKLNDTFLSPDEMESVKKLFYRYQTEESIDDITASDLEIDEIFNRFNTALSAPGRDFFYRMLRTPKYDKTELEKLNRKVEAISTDEAKRDDIRSIFLAISKMNGVNFFECIDYFETIPEKSVVSELLPTIFMVASVAAIFINSGLGIFMLIGTLGYNVYTYYKSRGIIESYIVCFSYMAKLIKSASKLTEIKIDALSEEYEELEKITKKLRPLTKRVGLVVGSSNTTGAGSPLDIVADYTKMFFHTDIIAFYKMLRIFKEQKDNVEEIYILTGKIESYIVIASLRTALPEFCIPEVSEGIAGENIYHPLIENPVKNSIVARKGVLITGSNASGKSTFLKTVLLNVLFAKTIYTCMADAFVVDDYIMFSSMSLRDDLLHKDSYFMVEIKALKRIFDYANAHPDRKVLCFVDEVLRGTNTIERIAACTQILKKLSDMGVLTFAATHDIELTSLLEEQYDNYHFDEEIRDDDVLFNYMIKPGKATSKNAIKLLSIMGFSDDIVDRAKLMADDFSINGVWR